MLRVLDRHGEKRSPARPSLPAEDTEMQSPEKPSPTRQPTSEDTEMEPSPVEPVPAGSDSNQRQKSSPTRQPITEDAEMESSPVEPVSAGSDSNQRQAMLAALLAARPGQRIPKSVQPPTITGKGTTPPRIKNHHQRRVRAPPIAWSCEGGEDLTPEVNELIARQKRLEALGKEQKDNTVGPVEAKEASELLERQLSEAEGRTAAGENLGAAEFLMMMRNLQKMKIGDDAQEPLKEEKTMTPQATRNGMLSKVLNEQRGVSKGAANKWRVRTSGLKEMNRY
jgi:hypothetical protein